MSSPTTSSAASGITSRRPARAATPGRTTSGARARAIPALIVSPCLKGNFVVDHTQYDTTSILATIEHRYGLAPLSPRDAAVHNLSNVFDAREAKDVGNTLRLAVT